MTPESRKIERKLSMMVPYTLKRDGDYFIAYNEAMKMVFAVSNDATKWGSIEWRHVNGKNVAVELMSPEAVGIWDRIKRRPLNWRPAS